MKKEKIGFIYNKQIGFIIMVACICISSIYGTTKKLNQTYSAATIYFVADKNNLPINAVPIVSDLENKVAYVSNLDLVYKKYFSDNGTDKIVSAANIIYDNIATINKQTNADKFNKAIKIITENNKIINEQLDILKQIFSNKSNEIKDADKAAIDSLYAKLINIDFMVNNSKYNETVKIHNNILKVFPVSIFKLFSNKGYLLELEL